MCVHVDGHGTQGCSRCRGSRQGDGEDGCVHGEGERCGPVRDWGVLVPERPDPVESEYGDRARIIPALIQLHTSRDHALHGVDRGYGRDDGELSVPQKDRRDGWVRGQAPGGQGEDRPPVVDDRALAHVE